MKSRSLILALAVFSIAVLSNCSAPQPEPVLLPLNKVVATLENPRAEVLLSAMHNGSDTLLSEDSLKVEWEAFLLLHHATTDTIPIRLRNWWQSPEKAKVQIEGVDSCSWALQIREVNDRTEVCVLLEQHKEIHGRGDLLNHPPDSKFHHLLRYLWLIDVGLKSESFFAQYEEADTIWRGGPQYTEREISGFADSLTLSGDTIYSEFEGRAAGRHLTYVFDGENYVEVSL